MVFGFSVDVTEEELTNQTATMITDSLRNSAHHPPGQLLSDDGLIMPRKPANPVKENAERQNLHKELLFNQKMYMKNVINVFVVMLCCFLFSGKNILNQKSELQRALEKQKDNMAKKQYENCVASRAPELEKVIADRAKRLQSNTNEDKVRERFSVFVHL